MQRAASTWHAEARKILEKCRMVGTVGEQTSSTRFASLQKRHVRRAHGLQWQRARLPPSPSPLVPTSTRASSHARGQSLCHIVCTIHRWAELSDVGSKCVGGRLVNCPCCSDPHVIDWETTTAATKLLHNSAMQLTDLIR
jgi:hypothetical protein